MVAVNAADDVRVTAGSQDRRGACVGVDACEVVGREREHAICIIKVGLAVQEEPAAGVDEVSVSARQRSEAQNLNCGCDIGEPLCGTRFCV